MTTIATPTILYVANKRLPPSDYRILFGSQESRYRIVFALPEAPHNLSSDRFIKIGFAEGVGLRDVGHFFQLARIVAAMRHTLSLTHYYSTKLILFGPMISALLGVPSIVTVTGLGRTFSNSRLMTRAFRRVYLMLFRLSARLCRRVLFQNRGDLEYLKSLQPHLAGKFEYIGSAVECPAITSKEYSSETLRVLLVSRLMPDKGIGEFLAVAAALSGKGFEFVLVGPGSRGYSSLLDRVRNAHNAGIIDYRGELDAHATWAEFLRAHVFYFPSYYGEGVARVMLEAGFAGLCPVACPIAANRDLIETSRGFMVAEQDPRAAIAVLESLQADRSLLRNSARAYQRHIVQNYSFQLYRARLIRVIDAVLESRQTSQVSQ